ncbi:hypothetical protein BT96DRAFT_886201 [Gymnopus androsaceus JB14]|uniref:Pentacotripeptide-repeat region of PRORP domain-containing protein n=1 Tax=Gymnopus androsaceus JB14 TaxID=1447944 RepID=A0A6A4HAV4_9AGAR|nr:hypothetical protein BT96DRAFT_886201 [Gymnopus androsaceus JB14]
MFLCRHFLHRLSSKPRSPLTTFKKLYFLPVSLPTYRHSSTKRPDLRSDPKSIPTKYVNATPISLPTGEGNTEGDQTEYRVALVRLLKEAVQAKNKVALGRAVRDLLGLPGHPERDGALRDLLRTDRQLLRWKLVQTIINGLSWDGILQKFSDHDLMALTKTLRISADQARGDGLSFLVDDFSALLHSTIMTRLNSRRRVPVGAKSVVHELPKVVDIAFELLYSLLLMKKEKLVLDLFQILTEKLYIPPEAVQQAPSNSTDFYYIISVTLARACLYWHKRQLAHRLLLKYLPSFGELDSAIRKKDTVYFPRSTLQPTESQRPTPQEQESQQSLDPQFLDLINDTLYATLRDPNLFELELCVDVISRVHLLAPVQSGIIRLMYTVAAESGFGDIARRLYAFTREPAIEAEHRYPGPQGTALLFLITFLTGQKGSTHLARTLANEVVENDAFLPVHDRSKFVTVVASQGFAKSARALWERYSVGKDRLLVVGSNTLLTRMVKLFTRIARTIEADLPEECNTEVSSCALEEKDSNTAVLEERAKDIREFVQRVIASFVEARQPLEEARHFDLSSLARAYFVTGDFAEGFRVFKFLIRRREVPDIIDINIGLSALAEHRPHSAAKLIEVMIGRGIQPDSVTFGTVIHQALLHNDLLLVGSLLQRARQAGNIKLSPQGLSSLTRASVSLMNSSGKRDTAHLEDALRLLKSMPKQGILSSPDMGKYMVFAALRENEIRLGFEFWKLLLQRTTEWDDLEHVSIRRLLRRRILETVGSGWERSGMLDDLQERPSYHAIE